MPIRACSALRKLDLQLRRNLVCAARREDCDTNVAEDSCSKAEDMATTAVAKAKHANGSLGDACDAQRRISPARPATRSLRPVLCPASQSEASSPCQTLLGLAPLNSHD